VTKLKKLPKKDRRETSVGEHNSKEGQKLKNSNSCDSNSLAYGDSDNDSNIDRYTDKHKGRNRMKNAETMPNKRTLTIYKSREVSPDSDDLSSFSASGSDDSKDQSSTESKRAKHGHKGTKSRLRHSSEDSELQRDPSSSQDSKESGDTSSDREEENPDNSFPFEVSESYLPEENYKMNSYSCEQDEISGSPREPSRGLNGRESSAMNYNCGESEAGRETFTRFRNSEAKVASYRKSTLKKFIWTQKDDGLLIKIVKKQRIKNKGEINWAKIEFDLAESRPYATHQLSSKDCKKRYHQLTKKKAVRDWTDQEVKTLLKLHKKFGNKWKTIAKKIGTKNDKQ